MILAMLIAMVLLVVVASFVATVTGFGFSTVAIPVLSFFFPLQPVVLLVSILHWFGDVWKVLLFHRSFNWPIILTFGIPSIVAAYIGGSLAFTLFVAYASYIFGLFLVAYALFLLRYPQFSIRPTRIASTIGGFVSGFSMGFFGIGGAIKDAFLLAYNLPKMEHLATIGAIGLCVDSVRLFAYHQSGLSLPQDLLWSLMFLIPASFVGAKIAQRYIAVVSQEKFRLGVVLLLLLAGMKMLVGV